MRLTILFLLASSLFAVDYVDSTLLLGDVGAKTITVTNPGSLGGTKLVTMPIGASQRFLFHASLGGYPESGQVTALSTGNTGVSGCTLITATWAGDGKAKATLTSGHVASWTIINPGNDYAAAPTVTTANAGCSQTPTATATIAGVTTCAAPCGISMDLQIVGPPSYWYEIVDSSGVRLSPRILSSILKIPQVLENCETTPFSVLKSVHGVDGYVNCATFTAASGTTTTNARLFAGTFNLRNGGGSVWANGGAHKKLEVVSILTATCTSGVCTFTTLTNHGLTNSQVAQLNMFREVSGMSPTSNVWMNDNWTVTVINSRSFSIVASEHSITPGDGDWYHHNFFYSGTATVSANIRYADEMRWQLGIKGPQGYLEMMVPLGASTITSGSNTVYWQRNGTLEAGGHGWWTDWAVVEGTDIECSQIVVSGSGATHLNAVATCTAHGYNVGDTILVQTAPGPYWRFNGFRVITAKTTDTITFLWGPEFVGTADTAPYTTPNGTYTVPVTRDANANPQPHMYVTRSLVAKSSRAAYDPTVGTYGGNVSNGNTAFNSGTLGVPDTFFPNHASIAHCSSCHMKDGYDLKYWGWNERVNVVAGVGRRLSLQSAKDVAAFVLSNSVTTPTNGRPWNPPVQPGEAISTQAAFNWFAGAGKQWQGTYDHDSRECLVPNGSYATWAYGVGVNLRDCWIALPLPHWMQWLPETSPLDWFNSMGLDFTQQAIYTDSVTAQATMTPGDTTTYHANGNYFNDYAGDYNTFALAYSINNNPAYFYPAKYQYMFDGAKKWQGSSLLGAILTNQDQVLYDTVVTAFSGASNARVPAMTTLGIKSHRIWFDNAPHLVFQGGLNWNVQNDLYDQTSMNWTLRSAQWYLASMIIDPGNGMAADQHDNDWGYYQNFNLGVSTSGGFGLRSHMYIHLMESATMARQTMGNALPSTGGNAGVILTLNFLGNLALPPAFAWTDYLTTDAEKLDIIQGLSDNLVNIFGAFSTAQWQLWADQTLVHDHGSYTRSTPSDPSVCATFPSYFPQSCLSYLLAVANTVGVTSGTKNALADWGDAVFPALGGRFNSTDKVATCTVKTSIPRGLTPCTNF